MIRLSPQLLIATAHAFVGLDRPPLNADQYEGIPGAPPDALTRAGRPGMQLDVMLVNHWGFWSHFELRSERSSWPIPAVHTANELANFGFKRRALHDEPLEGDIFLQYTPRARIFVHAGIVAQVCGTGCYSRVARYYDIITIEGNTNARGELGGGHTMRVSRRVWPGIGDRFLRWVELEGYDAITKSSARQADGVRRSSP
jgi:hypothetical protein